MFLDFKDDVLAESLNKVLSGLLPHHNYDASTFASLYPTLQQVLPIEDTSGVYYVMYTVLEKYARLSSMVKTGDFQIRITRERFQNALENNLPDLILDPKCNIKELMDAEGKSSDITIPTVQQEIMGVLYTKCMELYMSCYDLEQSYEDAMSSIVDLQDNIKANVIETGMQMQRAIMSTGVKYGRKSYVGPLGWMEFTQELMRQVSEIGTPETGTLICNDIGKLSAIEKGVEERREPLAGYGVPQLDDQTPMMRHRLAVFVARENVGKTRIMLHLAAALLRKGVKPFFACGETPKDSIFIDLVTTYIFQEYGMHFTSSDITEEGMQMLTLEDQQLITSVKARLISNGPYIVENLSYDNVTATMTKAYNEGCQAFFIDHTQSLRGRKGRSMNELVTNLALDCREFKNEYPVYVCVASHPSTDLKDLMQKDKAKSLQISPTAQSSTLSTEADEVFILYENDLLKKQNLLGWMTYKRRGAPKIPSFYIKKEFHVCSFVYDAKYQGAATMDDEDINELISSMGYAEDLDIDDPDEISMDI